jgi:hypothetical protein
MSNRLQFARAKKRSAPIEIKEEEDELPIKKLKEELDGSLSKKLKEEDESSSESSPDSMPETGPRNWQTLYAGIKEFRRINNQAAVDTAGCETTAARDVLPKVSLF